jgi:hypothetical protein
VKVDQWAACVDGSGRVKELLITWTPRKMRPTNSEKPPTVSDAIENELRQIEAGDPPTIRSRFLAIVGGLSRPDAMTAYATLAAAFAAFLAVKAAERQERATFTSALYSKQVDVTATFSAKVKEFVDSTDVFFPKNPSPGLVGAAPPAPDSTLPGVLVTDSDYKKIALAHAELESAFTALSLVYPKEAFPFLNVLAVRSASLSWSLPKQHVGSVTYERSDNIRDSGAQLSLGVIDLKDCAAEQLSEGEYIKGEAFNKCMERLARSEKR